MLPVLPDSISKLSTCLVFKGSCNSIDELDTSTSLPGEVRLCNQDGDSYVFDGSRWHCIGKSSGSASYDSDQSDEDMLKEIKCTSCGAPIKIHSRYASVECAYCGSIFQFIG